MIRKIICIAFCALALIGCKKESVETLDFENLVVTGEASDVTPFSATLSASFSPMSFMDVREACIYVSDRPEASGYIWYSYWYDKEANGEHDYRFTDFAPETTYYYWAEIHYSMLLSYHERRGEVKSFTTPAAGKDIVVTKDPDLESKMVCFRGTVSPVVPNIKDIPIWFDWGKINPDTGERSKKERYYGTLESDDSFTYTLEGVLCGYYRAGITFRGKEYIGEEKTWTLNQ